MRRSSRIWLYSMLLLSALIGTVRAADDSFAYQFLGNPLLVLVALIVIDAVAFFYRKIRR